MTTLVPALMISSIFSSDRHRVYLVVLVDLAADDGIYDRPLSLARHQLCLLHLSRNYCAKRWLFTLALYTMCYWIAYLMLVPALAQLIESGSPHVQRTPEERARKSNNPAIRNLPSVCDTLRYVDQSLQNWLVRMRIFCKTQFEDCRRKAGW